jgi:hypothetical protein
MADSCRPGRAACQVRDQMSVVDLNAGRGKGKINDFELARHLLLHGDISIAPGAISSID